MELEHGEKNEKQYNKTMASKAVSFIYFTVANNTHRVYIKE